MIKNRKKRRQSGNRFSALLNGRISYVANNTFYVLTLTLTLLFASCNYDHSIAVIEDRLDKLEGSSINSVEEQMSGIRVSIEDLKQVYTEIDGYIDALEATAADLQTQLDATNTKIDNIQPGTGSHVGSNLLNELDSLKTTLEGELAVINADIEALKAKDAELNQKIADLESYVKSEITATEDWANATFATLAQYEDIQTAIEGIKAEIQSINEAMAALETRINEKIAKDIKDAIDALRTELGADYVAKIQAAVNDVTSAYTVAIAAAKSEIAAAYNSDVKTAINDSETKMMTWVNEQLQQPLADIAALQAQIDALSGNGGGDGGSSGGDSGGSDNGGSDNGNGVTAEELADAVSAQQAALEQAKEDLTTAYEEAIRKAIADNNGVIDAEIAADVKEAQDALQTQIDAITGRVETLEEGLAELKTDFANRIQSLTYIPTHADGKATMYCPGLDISLKEYSRSELTFFVAPKSAVGSLKSEHITAQAVYTSLTRSVELIALPVTKFEGDTVTGTIRVEVSGAPLSDQFFHGESSASLFVRIDDGNSEYVSAPVELEVMSDKISDPADVVKGNLALEDGTFLKGSYITSSVFTSLSDDEKNAIISKVSGIVFWTVNDPETTAAGRVTPASLTDDKILQADFPDCTHGLIVALKDVDTNMVWQSSYESVYDNFQNTDHFTAENKTDYVSVGSSTNATDPVNYILGYQNTKVLQAYNAYCKETADKSDYVVQPVDALTEFSTTYPAPKYSSGWYIPSPKELHMLCYKDVDDIWNERGADKLDTKTTMDALLEKLGGDQIAAFIYWSSADYLYGENAWFVLFENAFAVHGTKSAVVFVRAVCAY